MDTQELLKKVRRIEIKSRTLSNNIFAGEYHSAFKGKGMSFAEVREYQIGDDVRDIDWNVTARFNKPYVKVFEEERELTVMLIIDVSKSLTFGTTFQTQKQLITEIAATLAFSAIANNDKIGVILFTDKIEKFIPPKKGKKHILYIVRELLNFVPSHTNSDVGKALAYLTQVIKKRCISFVISDFLECPPYKQELLIASKKHDVIALHIYDSFLAFLPQIGLLQLSHLENNETITIDTSSKEIQLAHKEWWNEHIENLNTLFSQVGVKNIQIHTNEDYVISLRKLFAQKG